MTVFTEDEISFLTGEGLLGRLATVGPDGMPHVTPVGWAVASDGQSVEIGGRDLTNTKKFRDIARTGRAAIVIDDVLPPWQPRGIEVRGPAEAIEGDHPLIRIRPQRIVSWGLDASTRRNHQARDVN